MGSTITHVAVGSFFVAEGEQYGSFDGRVAEVGIWSVALDDAEIAVLAAGYAPPCVRPQSLVFYAPLIRELNNYRGPVLSNHSTSPATVAVHPRIIQLKRQGSVS